MKRAGAFAYVAAMKRCPPDPTRRLLLGGLLSTGATAALGQGIGTSLRPMPRPGPNSPAARALRASGVADLVAKAGLTGKVGMAVADARTGEVLEVHNPLLRLPPASTAKAITALYALEHLGADHRYRTHLLATGPVTGGRVLGDLILAGSGDPTLDTDRLGALAAQLKEAGIFEVTGRLHTYDGGWPTIRSIDAGQPDHVGYSPSVAGLNLNFNRVHFEWRRAQGDGWNITMQARGRKYRPGVETARMEVIDRPAPVYAYSSQGGVDRWSVARSALGKEGARWLPVRRPEAYAAETFTSLARSYGIVLKPGRALNALPAGATPLASVDSAPLAEILKGMLRYSTNITAECLGLSSGALRTGSVPRGLTASGGEMAAWLAERTGASKARFVDHSGLGGNSRISARDMVEGLRQLAPQTGLKPLLREIELRDAQGRKISGSPVRIHAKTGTLNFVSSLAGFVDLPSGRELCFTVICADTPRRDALPKAQRERPDGNRAWVRRARNLHMAMIRRWAQLYA